MRDIVLASDSAALREEVKAVLAARDYSVREVHTGEDVLAACYDDPPDLVICDQQMGTKGGIATTIDLRLEESADRLPRIAILLLLDRRADVFLARRSGADGFVVKPLDPIRLRRAITSIVEGGTFEDDSYRPVTVAAAGSRTTANDT